MRFRNSRVAKFFANFHGGIYKGWVEGKTTYKIQAVDINGLKQVRHHVLVVKGDAPEITDFIVPEKATPEQDITISATITDDTRISTIQITDQSGTTILNVECSNPDEPAGSGKPAKTNCGADYPVSVQAKVPDKKDDKYTFTLKVTDSVGQVTEETKKGKVVGKLDPPPNFESTGSTPAIIGG